MYKGIIFSLGSNKALRNRSGGAHRIASELRQYDWDIEVADFVHRWPLEPLVNFFRTRYDDNIKFIAFSQLFTGWSPVITEFCRLVKEKYPHIVIIVGSMVYEDTGCEYIDYHVQGYGEISIVKLLRYLFSNGSNPGIVKVDNNNVVLSQGENKATPWKNPIIKYQERDFIQPWEWLSVEFSRGCIFQCAFCNFPELGVKGDYTRDADNFELQMKDTYDRFGVDKYIVSDETFNDRVAKITKFADAVERLDFDPFFSAFIRADLMVSRPQEREELLRMNLLGHFYGVETFNHKAGKSIGKGMNPEKLKQGLLDAKQYFKSHGTGKYRGTISLIAGLPHESNESLDASEQWLIDNWQDQSYLYFPLEIPKESVNQSSLLTLNFESYGYEKIGEKDEHYFAHLGLQTRSDLIAWKNEHTNYLEVKDRVDKFVKRVHDKQFMLGNFSLSSMGLSRDNDIDALLSLSNQSESFTNNTLPQEIEIVRDYVTKKINYRK